MSNKIVKPVTLALGAALIGSVSMAAVASTDLFQSQDLGAGYMLAGDDKPAEGKCGEGKCGDDKDAEGKCGEGKCGDDKDAEGKCGEGKCGEDKDAEGKCGEGKCGDDKKEDGSCGGMR